MIVVVDELRPEAKKTIKALKVLEIEVDNMK